MVNYLIKLTSNFIILSLFIHAGMSGKRDVVNGTKGQESERGSGGLMIWAKWMEGIKGSTEPEVFIMEAMPNQQSKNRVTYNYRTPT